MVTLNPHDFVFVTLIENAPQVEVSHDMTIEGQPIKNTTKRPLTLAWNSREYVLSPGKKTYVQLEAATNAFGDPRSGALQMSVPIGPPEAGERLFIPSRDAEVKRLRGRYGILTGDDTDFFDGNGTWRVPKVKLETMDGEELTTVLDDPKGNSVNPAATPTVTQAHDQQLTIEHLTKQVAALTKLVETQQATNPNPSLNDLPPDVDTIAPTTTLPEDTSPKTLDEIFAEAAEDNSSNDVSEEDETFDSLPADSD